MPNRAFTCIALVCVPILLWVCQPVAAECIATASGSDCSDGKEGNTTVVRVKLTTDAILTCPTANNDTKVIEWWYIRTDIRIGTYDKINNVVNLEWSRNDSYKVLDDGDLLLRNARRELVEEYHCVSVANGNRSTGIVYFRLDFSDWYAMPVFSSVFWGSCVSAVIFCAASFILNLIWIACRKVTLWWLNRAERMSRVRSMVEAMEKYRQRQLDSLQDTYHRRVNAIRDNYHQQVEQIRVSYSNQAGRFRDYRQARKHNVTERLDTMRDNYNQQLNRIRDYGSRRAEQLWESYERQLNRMRTFTLQQRLKLMRQYKVKQRYINKLLETIAETDNPETISKQEAAIRAALDLPDPPLTSPLTRSSSLPDLGRNYDDALPQFLFNENGELTTSSGFTQRSDIRRPHGRVISHRMAPQASSSSERHSAAMNSGRMEEINVIAEDKGDNDEQESDVTDPLLNAK
jgi:hypothetical protein